MLRGKVSSLSFLGISYHDFESHGKECLKRKALRRPQKTDIEGADVTMLELGSKCDQQQQGRSDRRRWTAMYMYVRRTASDSQEVETE